MRQPEREENRNKPLSRRIALWFVCVCVDYILIPMLVFLTEVELSLRDD